MAPLPLVRRLALIGQNFEGAVFTTSLGIEDQLLTWAIAGGARNIRIITLQTGRLFPQTLELIRDTGRRFDLEIEEVEPLALDVERYVERYGLDGFYDSVEARKACCQARKVAPLKRALQGAGAWVTGLRSGQSGYRSRVEFAQWDEKFSLVKLNPLADFSRSAILELVEKNRVPVNPLHARNYPSIGCEPCTRAIRPGEDERAGRWWWEKNQNQECGLHEPAEAVAATISGRAVSPGA